ncbi:LysR family transcriptional regulator [Xylophilus rhododendri]|uniref:LysR family transcriptional regulator n=1 Tax=Xylophilus rhododendri TaxID=2697032 RepID=A0A857JBI1_9BURK|nr:LysR family transcriptional regulator [Xylophilus rhododendri]QHJ00420.1 LysR family transcriptional regulator [Xylophilus rhododendri]
MGPGNRPLDLEWLEDFLALAETGNFSRAAEARNIAQPAFSRHIRSLEEWTGAELFDRSAHPAALTAAGKRFHPLLADVLAALEAARIKARAAQDQAAAGLRFAATHLLSLSFFPAWLSGLEAGSARWPIQMFSDSAHACEDLMLQRRVQFLMCHGHDAVPGRMEEAHCPMLRLRTDELLPVSVPGPDGAVPLHALDGSGPLPLLSYSDVSALGRILAARLGSRMTRGAAPLHTVFTAHHASLLRTMALEGRGIAWLPRSLVAEDLAAGRLVPAAGADWEVPLEIRLYRQRSEMSAAAESLWERAGPGLSAGP